MRVQRDLGGIYMTIFLKAKMVLLTILIFRLHENDENATVKWRSVNPKTRVETFKIESEKTRFSCVNGFLM